MWGSIALLLVKILEKGRYASANSIASTNAYVLKIQEIRKMPKKKTIPELFVARDTVFDKATVNIFKAIEGAVGALHEFMEVDIVEKTGGVLVWEDISLVEDGNDPLLILIGVIVYPPGVEFELPNGDKIKVTKDTAPYFRRLVRAGLPLSIADKTKQEVVEYLEKMEESEKQESELLFMDQSLAQETEFDLSKLTDEQRRAYEASMSIKGISKA